MHIRIFLLAVLVCLAAVPAMNADSSYMGGEIVLGGAGAKQITQVTQTTTAVPVAPASLQPVETTGSLSVTTSPAGAAILVDGVQRGISPATIPGLTAGSHTLAVKLDGYQDMSVPVSIAAGKTQTFSAALQPAAAAAPAQPAALPTKAPGFGAACAILGTGAILCARRIIR